MTTRKSPFLAHIVQFVYKKRYSKRTIDTYTSWIRRYINFHSKRHPASLNDSHVEAFLNFLVLEKNVSASTQAIVLNALNFLYKEIVRQPLSIQLNFVKSTQPRKLPVVLTQEEVQRLLNAISPTHYLIAALLYGSGLRLMEAMRLRVHGIGFEYNCIRTRNRKGGKHRIVS